MKNLRLIIIACGLAASLVACKHIGRHTIISESGNGQNIRIEYAGETYFNSDGTSIEGITPNGYVNYTRNDEHLTAESDSRGEVVYQINSGPKQKVLNENEKVFLAAAVKDMIKYGHYNDRRP